jgi:fibronectin type 3 domain-containing protein
MSPARALAASRALLAILSVMLAAMAVTLPAHAYSRGVNISGADFNDCSIPGIIDAPGTPGTFTYNTDPTFNYFGNKGLTLVRIGFRWERIQPTLNGPLNTANLNALTQDIAWAKAHGCKVVLDVHNYARYKFIEGGVCNEYTIDNVYGGVTKVSTANLCDLWVKLSTQYKNETGVVAYGMMNEPHDMGTANWKTISQAVLTAIRNNGDNKMIMVPGDGWASAMFWTNNNGSTGWITDPAHNFKYEAHQYFDHDASGTYGWSYDTELASNASLATVGQTRLSPFTSWCSSNGVSGFLGEYGVPNNDARWNTVLNNFMISLDSAAMDGTAWAGGEWWGTYLLSLQPSNNYTVDAPQMPTLMAHLGTDVPAPAAPTGVTATAGDAQVALNWNASFQATSYAVKRSTVSGSGYVSVATGLGGTSYTNTGLTNGTTYYYVMTASNSAGTSANSAQASATPMAGIPPIPTGLAAAAGIGQVSLWWNAAANATSYNVKRSTVSGSGYATVASPTATAVSNTGLTNGTTYYYVVSAVSATGQSANSAQASATPIATAGAQIASGTATIDGTVEAAWSGATAYGITHVSGTVSSSADLSGTWKGLWDNSALYVLIDVTDDVKKNDSVNAYDDDTPEVYLDADHNVGTGYDANDRQLEYGWGDAAVVEGAGRAIVGATFAKADPTGTTYRIEAKIPWSVAAYTPAANNVIGIDIHINDDDDGTARDGKLMWNDTTDGAWGNPSLFGAAQLMSGAAGPPATPTGLTATAGNTQVALAWNASGGATAYDVKRSTVSGSGYATITSPTGTSYTNTGLTNGTTYYYVVAAKNAQGSSANSSQVSATPNASVPPVPTGLTATAGNTQVALSWSASSGATAYDVKRSTVSGSGYATVSSPTATSYTNTGLTNGTTYYFVVAAKNATGSSANSAQVSATPTAGSSGNTHAGTWAAKGVLTTSATFTSLYQVVNVASNSTYVASIWIKGTGSVFLYLKGGNWGADIAGATVRCDATGTWTQYTTPAFSTGANTQITFIVQDNYGVAGTVYLDDAFLGVNTGTNMVANAGFESGNTTWAAGGVFSIVQPGGGSPPAAPTGLTATSGNAQIALSWTASSGATSYNVKRSTVNGSGYATVSSPTSTSYTNTGLTNGTTYYYVVTAVSANGESANSSQVSGTPSGGNTHAGTWAAKGVFTSTAGFTSLWQIANVASNSTYVASIWIKGTGSVFLYMKAGNWGADIAGATVRCDGSGTWTKFTTPAFSTGANTQVTFVVQDNYGVAGTAYMDDAFLGVNAGTNVLINPGFESGNTTWAAAGVFSIVQNP